MSLLRWRAPGRSRRRRARRRRRRRRLFGLGALRDSVGKGHLAQSWLVLAGESQLASAGARPLFKPPPPQPQPQPQPQPKQRVVSSSERGDRRSCWLLLCLLVLLGRLARWLSASSLVIHPVPAHQLPPVTFCSTNEQASCCSSYQLKHTYIYCRSAARACFAPSLVLI